jgi:hypothetical protein
MPKPKAQTKTTKKRLPTKPLSEYGDNNLFEALRDPVVRSMLRYIRANGIDKEDRPSVAVSQRMVAVIDAWLELDL